MEQKIKIKIAGKDLSLKANDPHEEAMYRRAGSEINDKIALYRNKYPKNSLNDFLSIIALLYAKEVQELNFRIEHDPLREDLANLSARLKDYLDKDKDKD